MAAGRVAGSAAAKHLATMPPFRGFHRHSIECAASYQPMAAKSPSRRLGIEWARGTATLIAPL